jgi:hypothetical protein
MHSKFAIGSNATNAKELYTSSLITSVSGGVNQITNAHFPHSHGGKISITYIVGDGSLDIATQSREAWRSGGWSESGSTFNSTNPLGTTNTTSNQYYPPYCIFMYIIRVS